MGMKWRLNLAFFKKNVGVPLRRISEILKGFLLMPQTLNAWPFLYNSGERLQLGSRAHTSWQAISAVVYASLTRLLCYENINTRGADSYNDSAHILSSPNSPTQIVNLGVFLSDFNIATYIECYRPEKRADSFYFDWLAVYNASFDYIKISEWQLMWMKRAKYGRFWIVVSTWAKT